MWNFSCPVKGNAWTVKLYWNYHICATAELVRTEHFPHWYEIIMIQVIEIKKQSIRNVVDEFMERILSCKDNSVVVIPPGLDIPIEVVDIILKYSYPHVGGWELKQHEN